MKKKFPIKPKGCLSTHGGAGYSIGDYWDKGAIVCGACGTRIENPPPTGGYNGTPTYPDFIKNIPIEKTSWGLRYLEQQNKKWWEFWR